MVTSYGEITINRDEVSQESLNIDNKVRSNLFAWNGQFSPQFIEALLEKYSNSNDIIFDPFLGSGTTIYEAARKNLAAFGVELNASAYHMAKVYEFVNINDSNRTTIIKEIDGIISAITDDNAIIPTIIGRIKKEKDPVISNTLSTLVILLDIFNNELTRELLQKKWEHLKDTILLLPYSVKPVEVIMGDARHVPREDNSSTLLITSPPYINVFNYHQKYRRSVEALGYNVLAIAKNEFGSNRKYRGNRFLTVIQYCVDMALSVLESSRICSEEARMIYVVGRESNVLGYAFCNSQLIYEICTEIFELTFLIRQERVFKNRYGQMIYEDVLHFANSKKNLDLKLNVIIEKARCIAVRMLTEKQKSVPGNKNLNLLLEAISKANNVKESEG